MINKSQILGLITVLMLFCSCSLAAQETIIFKPTDGDSTWEVRKAIEGAKTKDIKLVFEKGNYLFLPDYATDKYSYITNHGNGLKKVIFLLEDFDSVEIDGNGSEFIFHGQVAPFRFHNIKKVTVKNLTIDWDIPFSFQGEVVAISKEEGWRDIKPFTEGFSWKIKQDKLIFPDIDGFSFTELGSSLTFNKELKRVEHGAYDISSHPRWVEKRDGGILRFHEKLRYYPPVGSILHSKGPHGQNRYAPAFHTTSSKNVFFENIVIHHALGMGFLFERTEDIIIKECGVYVREGSDRVVSTIADATHFANCKGNILVEDCTFKHMLDDGTNVHGTYVEVNQVLDSHSLRVGLKHFEQMGFEFAAIGDEVWFIQNPSPKRASENVVVDVNVINDEFIDLRFKNELPKNIAKGDIIENKTWNPKFTMRGCTIKDHRARNIIIKTPKKIVIENNDLSSMMSSILFRGETFFWFESGAVEDVLIRNNNFNYVAYSGSEHAVLYVTPRLGKTFDQTELYDRNIRFENNTITTFGNRIVIADRVDGLKITGNTINQADDQGEQLYPNTPQFELINCNDVEISNNTYKGKNAKAISADETSLKTLKTKGNKGFSNLE
ncbi:right-handed parallel beta-helix repeat-containing protein [Tamlana sp. 2_MG-2023]|uniref:right-handed parallel beta-helix repeat-containing protein n=1 Tax=unclassified Tamlana TaxID=2614803 RepID=UPI0026E42A19|nr:MULTISPECIES: right-handed parallel beta-helix repeat-containing protein [unclassified Tamlana]MDO6760962.1 right-handed parallel beta-helix repeat-containing protein [Tamlana sp. 2_MG-2023]MDO6791218.1 right-handed parallel beta-helix repeat-containing protein [Tamlana sp. 1_MG-2023]